MCGSDIFLGVLAILFPPIAVWVKRGICSADSFINIALCGKHNLSKNIDRNRAHTNPAPAVLGFLPGLFHAWYIIATYPEPTYSEVPQDVEDGNGRPVTYYYVQQPQGGPQYARQGGAPAPKQGGSARVGGGQRGYGTVSQGEASGSGAPVGGQEEVPPTYQQAMGDHKVQR